MIDKLEMFMSLARERHFGRAAMASGVTQPTLSSAIRQIEEQLGVQLVHRGARFQGLTPEGLRLLDWARRITGDVRALKDEMRMARAGLSGQLRLGVIPTALPMVADLTAPLLLRHAEVQVRILSRSSSEILAGIETLDLDAGITYLDNEPLGRLTSVSLYDERYCLLCAGGTSHAARAEVTWAEVAVLPLCLLTGEMQNRRIVNQHLSAAGPAVRVESNSSIALAAHVMTGTWASVVPQRLAEVFATGDRLCAIPITGPEVVHKVGLVTPQAAPHTPLIEALLDTARRIGRG